MVSKLANSIQFFLNINNYINIWIYFSFFFSIKELAIDVKR